MAKKTNETVEDIMKTHLTILEHSDKLSKLEKESLRDKKIIQELKEREKVSARALVLFERKIKFLKESIVADLLKLCKMTGDSNDVRFGDNSLISEVNEKLYGLCNKLEELSVISESDRAFILNKPVVEKNEKNTQSRFDRLKASFEQKIGNSVLRKPGRPKKQDQSIVADLGLGKKVEKVVDEQVETKNRLNEIFYGTPTQQKAAVSNIPQTEDSAFDFAEALNPNHSLQDIMSDIMSDSPEQPIIYSKDNIDNFISKTSEDDIKKLEEGIISKPHLHDIKYLEDDEKTDNKKIRKNGVLTSLNLFDKIKR